MKELTQHLEKIGLNAKHRANGVDVEMETGLVRKNVEAAAHRLELSAVPEEKGGATRLVIQPQNRRWTITLRNAHHMDKGAIFRVEHMKPESISEAERNVIAALFHALTAR